MPPKKNAVKMDLNSFLQDESFGSAPSGSWADEEMPLPNTLSTQPPGPSSGGPRDSTPMDWNAAKRDAPMGMGMGMGGRPPREPREPVPVPDKPPFTARLLNLDYSVGEDAIASLFDPATEIVSIRVPHDHTGRPRGFAFVEFKERQALEQALELTGTNFMGRELRVYVAEKAQPNDERFGGDWRAGPRGEPREPDNRDYSNWERRGPLPPLERQDRPERRGPPKPKGRLDERFMDMDWERKGPLPPREPRQDRPGFAPRGGPRGPQRTFDNWRSDDDKPRPTGPRTKINLAPRTVGAHENTPPQAEERSSALFGGAKPIDTTQKLLEVEEQVKKEEQAKIDAVKIQKEKIQAAQDEKRRKENERAEQVRKRFNLLRTDDDEEEDDSKKQAEEPAKAAKAPTDETTEAEKVQASEASKEELEDGNWEVVNRRK